MKVHVEVFTHSYGNIIPAKYTCYGEEISPRVQWNEVPEGTGSFTLIMEALDIPERSNPFTLWLMYDIPAKVRSIATNTVPEFAKLGTNDNNIAGYSGPCPESGPHYQRYRITIYALDQPLDLPAGETKHTIDTAMKNHILAKAETIGIYKHHT